MAAKKQDQKMCPGAKKVTPFKGSSGLDLVRCDRCGKAHTRRAVLEAPHAVPR